MSRSKHSSPPRRTRARIRRVEGGVRVVRNVYALDARTRKGGAMRSDCRGGDRNWQQDYLIEHLA